MEYTTLGRTGLKVSVAGFGSGGHSRLGQEYETSEQDSIALLQEAMDLGVNFFDTAENYDTEKIVGAAIAQRTRSDIVVSTKTYVRQKNTLLKAADLVGKIDLSLTRLATDYIDIFDLHGVDPEDYDYAIEELLPVLVRVKEAGKIRFLGMTEGTSRDPHHKSLSRAAGNGNFDVVMFAFHMMHQNARHVLLPKTTEAGIGTVAMCAMRGFFSDSGAIRTVLSRLEASGRLPADTRTCEQALQALVHPDGANNIVDAAYRYARHEPGINVVLFGTGKREHLRANIASITRPPLPAGDIATVERLFGELVGVGLTADQSVRHHPPGIAGPTLA